MRSLAVTIACVQTVLLHILSLRVSRQNCCSIPLNMLCAAAEAKTQHGGALMHRTMRMHAYQPHENSGGRSQYMDGYEHPSVMYSDE